MVLNYQETKPYGVYLDATLKLIRQDIIRRFKTASIDLTPEQWTILSELAGKQFVYQRELAATTFKDAPTVSRIIELLKKRELIKREEDDSDRRRTKISLTASGQEIYDNALPIIVESRQLGWRGLNDLDYSELTRILETITANITSVEA